MAPSRLLGVIRFWRGDRIIYPLLIVSLSINVLLGHERQSRDPRSATETLLGTVMPVLSVSTTDGRAAALTWSGRDTIFYYFHPDCRWCQRNADAVAALERQTRARFDFVAVTSAHPAAHATGLPSATYWALSDGERRQLHLAGTPQTLLIAHGGRVLQSFAGAYAGETKRRLERFFQVELPAIAPTQSTR